MELTDFEFFKKNQLANVDFETGQIDTFIVSNLNGTKWVKKNVGSLNGDNYTRVWCNGRLRMKHRLLYWLFHNTLPEEIDHIDGNRQNNCITNLRSINRKQQLQNIKYPSRNRFRFTDAILERICLMFVQGYNNTQIAQQLGCSRTAIKDIRSGRRHSSFTTMYLSVNFNDYPFGADKAQ